MVENLENNLEQSAEQIENQVQNAENSVESTESVGPKTAKKTKANKVTEPVAVDSPLESDPGFDWDKYKEGDYQTEFKKSDLEKMYNDTLSAIKVNEVVDGTVISMNKREVVVNIGYKSEGVVSLNEFRYDPDLKIGDKVEVYIESQEDKKGQLVLSHKKARALKSWDRVNESLE